MFTEVTTPQMAFLKMGIFGFQGAGKTRTATEVAIDLHRHIKSQKGVVFIDTETGSDFMLPLFRKVGIRLYVDKTRAFAELCKNLDEAPKEADIVIIDSITHFWRELVKAYKTKKHLSFLRIQDWGPLKEEWQQFSDRYVNSRLHLLMCGRASNVFEDVEGDEDNDAKKSWKAVKVGTKMAAEGETGYEPSLLVEMVKVFLQEGGKYVRRASVIKDRFGVIDSQEFDFGPDDKPGSTFKYFLPHIELLNLGGEHIGVDTSKTSEALFGWDGSGFAERRRQQAIHWEEIEGLKAKYLPGTTTKEKFTWTTCKDVAFGTVSDTKIQSRLPVALENGRDLLEHLIVYVLEAEQYPDKVGEFKRWLDAEKTRYLTAIAVEPPDAGAEA